MAKRERFKVGIEVSHLSFHLSAVVVVAVATHSAAFLKKRRSNEVYVHSNSRPGVESLISQFRLLSNFSGQDTI